MAYGHRALRQQGQPAKDGEELHLNILIGDDRPTFSCNEIDLPCPESLLAIICCHVSAECVQQRRFRIGDVEVATTQQTLFGEDRQLTLVAEPLPDGGRKMKLSVGPANPKRTKV